MDTKPFTTGPRRSLALQGFVVRQGDNYVAMRNRMASIIAEFSNSPALLGEGSRIWASFSKPKEARMNGDWCAWVRRIVRKVDPEQEKGLEPEYNSGTCWLHGVRVSSAVHLPDGIPDGELMRDEARPSRPWIHLEKIAYLMKRQRRYVDECAACTKR